MKSSNAVKHIPVSRQTLAICTICNVKNKIHSYAWVSEQCKYDGTPQSQWHSSDFKCPKEDDSIIGYNPTHI